MTGDTLAASTSGTSITASYNASTGVLSLTGSDTLAHYQQVLDSVSYSSTNQNPTNSGADPSRTVSWTVNDGTLSSATQTTTVNITGGPATASLFSPSATPGTITENDPNAVDLGVKFQASTNGTIIGIRFYKGPQNTGTHIGDLWTTSGTLLASATFTNETASGWQQVNFSTPVSITAGTTYIASYQTNVGEYSADSQLLHQCAHQRPADRAIELIERRQRGLCLWQLESLPEQHLQRQQLLGRRRLQPERNPDTASAQQCRGVCLLYRSCGTDNVVVGHDRQRPQKREPRLGNGVDRQQLLPAIRWQRRPPAPASPRATPHQPAC